MDENANQYLLCIHDAVHDWAWGLLSCQRHRAAGWLVRSSLRSGFVQLHDG